jgi:uncharacterized protein GlcG (DUF336 family)
MLTLALARSIADATLAEAARLGLAPLAVVVLDAGGHILVALRDERAGILRHDIALAKAWGSLGMGFGSRSLGARVEKAPAFFAAISAVSQGRMAPSPGGVLILDQGRVVGAIGVSGDLGDRDEACALAGIAAAGLAAAT